MRRKLIVQTAQGALYGAAVVVLYERDGVTNGLVEGLLVVALVEEAAFVFEHAGFKEQDVGDF